MTTQESNRSGSIRFTRLDPERGTLNIGSHPENDIVIQDPRVKPFHLTIDFRQKPYRIYAPDPQAEITILGEWLAGAPIFKIDDLADIQFAGYELLVREDASGQADSLPEAVAVVPVSKKGEIPAATPLPGSERLFEVEMVQKDQEISVGQTATFQLNIRNKGLNVADFKVVNIEIDKVVNIDIEKGSWEWVGHIRIDKVVNIGIEKSSREWVGDIAYRDQFTGELEQDDLLRLNERSSTREGWPVEIPIHPPRDSGCSAGTHPVTITVQSPSYEQTFGKELEPVKATGWLTILPYYNFKLDGLYNEEDSKLDGPTHRDTSVKWSTMRTTVNLSITNCGNSEATYHLTAQDNENGLKLTFPQPESPPKPQLKSPDSPTIPAGGKKSVPLDISPLHRPFISLSPKRYTYSVTATSEDDKTLVQQFSGTYTHLPLLGLKEILLVAAAFALVLTYLMVSVRPRITSFTCTPSEIKSPYKVDCNWEISGQPTRFVITGSKGKLADFLSRDKDGTPVTRTNVFVSQEEYLTLTAYYQLDASNPDAWAPFKHSYQPFHITFTPGKHKVNIGIDSILSSDGSSVSEAKIWETVRIKYNVSGVPYPGESGSDLPVISGSVLVRVKDTDNNKKCELPIDICELTMKEINPNTKITATYLSGDNNENYQNSLEETYKPPFSVVPRPVDLNIVSAQVGGAPYTSPTEIPAVFGQPVTVVVSASSKFYKYQKPEETAATDHLIGWQVTLRDSAKLPESEPLSKQPLKQSSTLGSYTATFENFNLNFHGGKHILTFNLEPPDGTPVSERTFQGNPIKLDLPITVDRAKTNIENFNSIPPLDGQTALDLGQPITMTFDVGPGPENLFSGKPSGHYTVLNVSEGKGVPLALCTETPGEDKTKQYITCTFTPKAPFPQTNSEKQTIPYLISIEQREGNTDFYPPNNLPQIEIPFVPYSTSFGFISPKETSSPYRDHEDWIPFTVQGKIPDGADDLLDQARVDFFKDGTNKPYSNCGERPVTIKPDPDNPSTKIFEATCLINLGIAGDYTVKAKFKSGNNVILDGEVVKVFSIKTINTTTKLEASPIDRTGKVWKITFTATVQTNQLDTAGSYDVSTGNVTLYDANDNQDNPIDGRKIETQPLRLKDGKYQAEFALDVGIGQDLGPGTHSIYAKYDGVENQFNPSPRSEIKDLMVIETKIINFQPEPRVNPITIPKDGSLSFKATIKLVDLPESLEPHGGTVHFSFNDGPPDYPLSCIEQDIQIDWKGGGIGEATCTVENTFINPAKCGYNVSAEFFDVTLTDGRQIILLKTTKPDPNPYIDFK